MASVENTLVSEDIRTHRPCICLVGICLKGKVYGPNQDDPNFFVNLFFNITCPPTELIIGGDFKLVLDPVKDRSSPTSKSLSSAGGRRSISLPHANI